MNVEKFNEMLMAYQSTCIQLGVANQRLVDEQNTVNDLREAIEEIGEDLKKIAGGEP